MRIIRSTFVNSEGSRRVPRLQASGRYGTPRSLWDRTLELASFY
jgi:hypothetical protein